MQRLTSAIRRLKGALRRWRMTPAERHQECVDVSRMIRDMAHERLGIWLSDEELDLNVRFTEVAIKLRKDRDCEGYLVHQLYACLSHDRKLQIVTELEDYFNRKGNR